MNYKKKKKTKHITTKQNKFVVIGYIAYFLNKFYLIIMYKIYII
jgi:hypothetical protein